MTPGGLYDRFIDAVAAVGATLLAGMSLWICGEVILRYVFRSPTIWAIDLSEYAMLAAAFLGGPWLVRREAHVRITLLVVVVSPAVQRLLGIGTSVVGAMICALLCWLMGTRAAEYEERGMLFVKAWVVPQWPPYAIVALCCALMAIEFVRRALRYAGAKRGEADLRPTTPEDWSELGGERF